MRQPIVPELAAAAIAAVLAGAGCVGHDETGKAAAGPVQPSVATDFNPEPDTPALAASAHVCREASVIGSVEIGERVMIAPGAFVRGDEGQHIRIGDDSNVQDCAGVHALETVEFREGQWRSVAGRLFTADGRRVATELVGDAAVRAKKDYYSVYIGNRVSVAHQALVHGPAWIGDDTFVGMQAQVFNAKVGAGSVVLPHALVMGVEVPAGRLVPAGAVVTSQAEADKLGPVEGSGYEKLDAAVVHVNVELAEKYNEQARGAGAAH